MQVRVSDDGHLIIPPAIRKELGIQPGTWLDVAAIHGVLQVSVVQAPARPSEAMSDQAPSRLATLKPHPDAIVEDSNDLDKVVVWDVSDWAKEWQL